MRVYLPATLPGLASLLRKAEIGPAPLRAFAVTPALREWYASGDPDAPRRRVVLAADMPEEQVGTAAAGFDEPTLVEVQAPVPLDRVMSGHIDDEVAMPDVARAVAALPAADSGDEDARFVVDGAEGHELLWYASQELPNMAG